MKLPIIVALCCVVALALCSPLFEAEAQDYRNGQWRITVHLPDGSNVDFSAYNLQSRTGRVEFVDRENGLRTVINGGCVIARRIPYEE
jgi:hypothetical protein